MRSRSICTMRNCRRTIFLVWVLASLLSGPAVWVTEGYSVIYTNNSTSVSVYYCQETETSWPFALYQVITIFALPGLFLSVCYTYVIRELWKSTRTITMLTNASSFRSRNVRRSAKATTRLTTVEEESMYTSTTQEQPPKRMDSIRPTANFSSSSPRTETATLTEIDTVVDVGSCHRREERGNEENMQEIEHIGACHSGLNNCGGNGDNGDGLVMDEDADEDIGVSAAIEDINGNAMKEDSEQETEKIEDLEACGKKSEMGNEIEDNLDHENTVDFEMGRLGSVNEVLLGNSERIVNEEDAQNKMNEKLEGDVPSTCNEEQRTGDGQPSRRNRNSLKNPLLDKDMETINEALESESDEHQKSPKSEHCTSNTLDTLKRTRSRLQSLFRKKSHLTTQQMKAEEAKNARKQVILMLILVIILFMICWGPRVVYTVVLKACGSEESCKMYYTPFWYKVKVFFSLIPYVHCSINPFIYSFMSKNFKRSMRRQLNRLEAYFGCNLFGCKGPSSDTKRLMQLKSHEVNRTVTGHINESTTNIV